MKTFTYEYTKTHIIFLVNGEIDKRFLRTKKADAQAYQKTLVKAGCQYTMRPSLVARIERDT